MLVVAAGVLLCACRGDDASSLAESAATSDLQRLGERIDAIAEAALRDGPVAGLSIAVFRGYEPVLAKGYGFSDVEARKPASAETTYDVASVSKLFTALAVLKLADVGKLDLDDSLSTLLPEFPNPDQGRRITVRQVLRHTSGLNDYLAADFVRLLHSEQPVAPLTASFILDYLKGRALDSEPGAEWQYSNSGFFLAGMIVEKISGQPWGEYVRDAVARPLGLHATMSCDVLQPEQRTGGYVPAGAGFEPNFMYAEAGVQGDGGLCSTVLDLARLPAALAGYRLIPEGRIREMLRPTELADGVTVDYGLGVRLGQLDGHDLWGHTGSVLTTFASTLAHYPQEDVTIAVLVNTADTAADALVIEGLVAKEVLNLGEAGSEAMETPDGASVYIGEYVGGRDEDIEMILAGEVPNERIRSRIVDTGDGLARIAMTARDERPPLELVPLGNHRFGREDWPMDRFVFAVEGGDVRGYSEYYNGMFATFNRRVGR
jgi:CubicO group peptidase (beta-lactamase class C family)